MELEKYRPSMPIEVLHSWADDAQKEIESLRAQLGAANAEVQEQARLNGMGAEREAKLRAQLEEAKKELEEANETASNNFAAVQEIDLWLIQHDMLKITHEGGGEAAGLNVVDALENMHQQLLATQAHAARMENALEIIAGRRQCIDNLLSNVDIANAALSTPISLDALHEDRALTLEEAKRRIYSGEFDTLCAEDAIQCIAYELRAKKEGK